MSTPAAAIRTAERTHVRVPSQVRLTDAPAADGNVRSTGTSTNITWSPDIRFSDALWMPTTACGGLDRRVPSGTSTSVDPPGPTGAGVWKVRYRVTPTATEANGVRCHNQPVAQPKADQPERQRRSARQQDGSWPGSPVQVNSADVEGFALNVASSLPPAAGVWGPVGDGSENFRSGRSLTNVPRAILRSAIGYPPQGALDGPVGASAV
jgi:hypothetical protein